SEDEVLKLLEKQGYTRVFARHVAAPAVTEEKSARKKSKRASSKSQAAPGVVLEMIQDRLRFDNNDRSRMSEALKAALRVGQDRATVHAVADETVRASFRFSSDLHCPECDIRYQDPAPSLFSFNSPLGACDTCRGFGRSIGIDFGLIVPDESK